MKHLVRVISTCSIVALGAMAVPAVASAAPTQAEHASSTAPAAQGVRGRMVERALDQVDLKPEQKDAIDQLKSEADARHAPVKAARRALMLKIADQLEQGTGKIDQCQLTPQIKAIASAVAKVRPADRDAFEKLHDILDADQRSTFADTLKQEFAAARRAHQPSAIVDKMGKDLNLSADQKDALTRIVTGLQEIRQAQPAYQQRLARMDFVLDAFKKDNFNLDEVAPMGDVAQKVTDRIEARLAAAQAIIPVLNQQQRTTAAKKLRDRAQRMGSEQHGVGSGSSVDTGES